MASILNVDRIVSATGGANIEFGKVQFTDTTDVVPTLSGASIYTAGGIGCAKGIESGTTLKAGTTLEVGSNLTVANDATIGNDLTINNDTSMSGTLVVGGISTFSTGVQSSKVGIGVAPSAMSTRLLEIAGSTSTIAVDSYGKLGIGKTSPDYSLDVDGSIRCDKIKANYSVILEADGSGVLVTGYQGMLLWVYDSSGRGALFAFGFNARAIVSDPSSHFTLDAWDSASKVNLRVNGSNIEVQTKVGANTIYAVILG